MQSLITTELPRSIHDRNRFGSMDQFGSIGQFGSIDEFGSIDQFLGIETIGRSIKRIEIGSGSNRKRSKKSPPSGQNTNFLSFSGFSAKVRLLITFFKVDSSFYFSKKSFFFVRLIPDSIEIKSLLKNLNIFTF